jgi:hypothetical protein
VSQRREIKAAREELSKAHLEFDERLKESQARE